MGRWYEDEDGQWCYDKDGTEGDPSPSPTFGEDDEEYVRIDPGEFSSYDEVDSRMIVDAGAAR